MKTNDPNIGMVEFIAEALGPLTEELVFVGGCAAGLMITDPGRAAIRATNDVDLIVEITNHGTYYTFTEQLRASGFQEDPDIVCRWKYQGVKVDVMPSDEAILGFTNKWYEDAIRTSVHVKLPSSKIIRLISPPLLVATKIEAFYGRGDGDYQGSHDLEDIISVIDGRQEIVNEIAASDEGVKAYLENEVEGFLADPAFVDSISYHLMPDQVSQARVPLIIERLRGVAGL